jgi:nucleoside-diphosphate-sugar epimerase
LGCIGAWVVHELVGQGVEVVAFDKGDDDFRIRYLLDDSAIAQVTQVQGDIVDPQVIRGVVHDYDITNVVHLAALQMPPCSENPRIGALVNVVGTINVFEAVRDTRASERPIVYSSSVAAFDAPDEATADASTPTGRPASHYGVFKVANEGNARVFARELGISSIGLRPHIVYGVGRDQGRTSAITKAILAAARNEPFEITFTGFCQMQYAQDVAKAFIAASRTDAKGALVVNIDGPSVDVQDVVGVIRDVDPVAADRITASGDALPFPGRLPDDDILRLLGRTATTSLADGVHETMRRFRELTASGMLRT